MKIRARLSAPLAVLTLLAACGDNANQNAGTDQSAATTTDTMAATAMPSANDSAAPMPAASGDTTAAMDSAMAAMDPNAAQMPPAKDAEQQFMRMMTDHHEGMIAMSNALLAKNDASAPAKADAQKLKADQQAEQKQMLSMLRTNYQESFQPKITPQNQKMVADVSQASGKAADKAFWSNVVQHHQQALDMINRFAPRFTRPEMKQMAEKMRTTQMQQIEQFKKKIAQG